MNRWKYFLFLLLPINLVATEYRPWFGEDKLIEIRPSYTYLYYPHVDVNGRSISHYSDNHLAGLSISAATDCTWAAEAEIHTAATKKRGYSLDDYKFTLRYRPFNDCVGDLLSVTTGISISQVTTSGRRDLSTFHPGQMEYEFHIATGKEIICRQFWTSRFWGLIGTGIANRGSPWLRAIAGYDANHWNCYHYGIYIHGLYGIGEHDICLSQPFRGYGAIKYRSIDISAYYTKHLHSLGEITLKYTLRPWAHNFPTHAHALTLTLMIPYSL